MNKQDREPYLFCCPRCMGHGHFSIPSKGDLFEFFSQEDAYQQLRQLVSARRVSRERFVVLTSQVRSSGLPASCPPDVKDCINAFCQTESWAACFSQGEEAQPKNIRVDSSELALAVHEFYLASPDRALRLQ